MRNLCFSFQVRKVQWRLSSDASLSHLVETPGGVGGGGVQGREETAATSREGKHALRQQHRFESTSFTTAPENIK